jgi:hypothetical protein
VNCVEDTLTKIRSKWLAKQNRRNEVREDDSLNEKTEEDISTRKRDRGQINKWKNPPIDVLENLAGKKDRQACKALKMRVKLT